MENENTRNISDMYFAAALLSYGAELVSVDRTNVRRQRFEFKDRVKFVFIEKEEEYIKVSEIPISDVETHYVSKTLVYPPSYPDAIRRIKSAIHGYE